MSNALRNLLKSTLFAPKDVTTILSTVGFQSLRTKATEASLPRAMPGDKKLETVEELQDLFKNEQKLKEYRYTQPIVSSKGIDNEKFHMELPYQEIKEIVQNVGDTLLAKIPEEERAGLRWEHVGSTSIEGMPGALLPDALLIIPSFPPSKGVIQAFLDCGFYFSSASHLDPKDLWWFLVFTEGILEDSKLTVHCCLEDCTAAKILLECRDMCRTEEWAFNDYKTAKVNAATGTWEEYKKGKGSNSKLLTMLREKHGQK